MILCLKKYLTLHAPDAIFLPLINISNKLQNRRAIVKHFENHIYTVNDGQDTVYTCRRSRIRRYFFGIAAQCEALAHEYLFQNVPLKEGDVIVDCGANNGEIGIWAQKKKLNYYAFEPEPLEARCCDLNNYNGDKKTFRLGLWHEQTTLSWYSEPEDADSSLIQQESGKKSVSIKTTTLNDFARSNNIERIRLFKLEAEGAEPEVLQGALTMVDKIDYISVDCGYERGIAKNHTFMEVYNILKDHDFEIIAAEFKRVIFLFKRKGA